MISNRIKKNKENGKVFIPMNVDGGIYDNKFMSSGKISILVGVIIANWMAILTGKDNGWTLSQWFMVLTVIELVSLKLIRVFVLEEKHFYKSYTTQKKLKKAKTYILWEVTSIDERGGEGIIKYADGKKAVIVKLERNTIVGRNTEFKEDTYDSLSNYYRDLNRCGLSYVIMSTMDKVGKDVKLDNLSKKPVEIENKNMKILLEYQVGYILSISRATLFETESILLYSKDMTEGELLNSVNECMSELMGGAYIKYEILNKRDILKVAGERAGVDYINYYDATLSVYAGYGFKLPKTFSITKVILEDGEEVEIDDSTEKRIIEIAREKESGSITDYETALIKTIDRVIEKSKQKVVTIVESDMEIDLEDDTDEDVDFMS